MKTNAEKHYETWPAAIERMKSATPETARAFGTLFHKLMGEGALSVREKEMIALAIGVALRCEACIYAHLEKALAAGATREQVLELAGVVVMMQGGPGYVYVPRLVEALDALEQPGRLTD